MDAEQVEGLAKTEVLPTLADKLGVTASEAQQVLFETWHPEALWIDIGLIGLASIVGMVLYDRVLRYIDGKKAA